MTYLVIGIFLSGDPVSAEVFAFAGLAAESLPDAVEVVGGGIHQRWFVGEDAGLVPGNIIESRKFEIVTPVVKVSVVPEYTHQVKTKMVDGRMCLVIPVDGGVEVNGVPVYTENRAVEAGDALD